MPALLFFAIFVGVPLIEIMLFIQVGSRIGVFPTIALIIITAIIGTIMLRTQGLATLARAQSHLGRGEMPVDEVLTGFFLVVAGAFLLTPGFFTDAIGFLLFVPAVRRAIAKSVFDWMLKNGKVNVYTSTQTGGQGGARRPGGPGVIDGEFEDITPQDGSEPKDPRLPPRS